MPKQSCLSPITPLSQGLVADPFGSREVNQGLLTDTRSAEDIYLPVSKHTNSCELIKQVDHLKLLVNLQIGLPYWHAVRIGGRALLDWHLLVVSSEGRSHHPMPFVKDVEYESRSQSLTARPRCSCAQRSERGGDQFGPNVIGFDDRAGNVRGRP